MRSISILLSVKILEKFEFCTAKHRVIFLLRALDAAKITVYRGPPNPPRADGNTVRINAENHQKSVDIILSFSENAQTDPSERRVFVPNLFLLLTVFHL